MRTRLPNGTRSLSILNPKTLLPVLFSLSAAACGESSPASNPPSGTPPPPSGTATPTVLAFALDSGVTDAKVDGLAIRTSWARLEPTEGRYDWTALDSTLAEVAAAKKKATLHVLGSGYAQVTPSWLMAAGVQFYNGFKGPDPVPWDPVFLQKWGNFLPKLAEHLRATGGDSVLLNMTVAVPVPEMNLFSCRNGMLDGNSIAYDRAKYMAAWTQMVDLYQANFPQVNRFISAPQNGICLADNDTQFFTELMRYAQGKDATHHFIFAADLSAQGSARTQPYLSLAPPASLSFQPVAAYTNDPNHWVKGTLLQLYCSGLKLGGTYFEVYASDLSSTDSAVQQGISAIHQPSLCP